MKLLLRAAPLLALAALAYAALFHGWGLLYGLGVHPYPGPQTPWTYQMWSGIVPALTVLTLFGSLGGVWRHANCNVRGCWRLGRFQAAGGQFKVCAHHHPDEHVHGGGVDHRHLARLHREYLERQS